MSGLETIPFEDMKKHVENGAHMLEPVVIAPQQVSGHLAEGSFVSNLILVLYLAGASILSTRLVYQLFRAFLLVKRYGITRYNGLNLVVIEEDTVPFSMMNMVFIARERLSQPHLDKIIAHERAHIRQHHFMDLLLVELCLIIQWFNPLVWLFRRAIKNNHEYQADQHVLSGGYNRREYQELLLNQTFKMQFATLSNKFNQSLTKKRFIMMTKNGTTGIGQYRLALILPVAMAVTFILSLGFSGIVSAAEQDSPTSPQDEPVYKVVEEMPKFPGGQDALTNYMVTNVKYPENARKNGVQGTVFVTFVVEKDGKISDARVLKGVDEELDKEALRVVSEMPKWSPGKEKGKPVKVQFNLPIAFKLDAGKKKTDDMEQPPKRYMDVKKNDK